MSKTAMKSTPKTNVLVVGAGALGITTSYFLQCGGADISFLVRPNRLQDLSRPQKLYSYGDHSIKQLSDFQVYTSVEQLAGQYFDFVLLTLDGASCRQPDAIKTLKALGKSLRNTHTCLLICGVGLGLYEHVLQTTAMPKAQVLEGTMGLYAYQVARATAMPLPEPTNRELHNSADIAFLNFNPERSFLVTAKPSVVSKAFAQAFDRSGLAKCSRMPVGLYRAFTSAFFAYTTACELTHWHSSEAVLNNAELWPLCCQSQREILRLKQHGLLGKIMSWVMTDKRQAEVIHKADKDAASMNAFAFNHFHHGGKVQDQDIGIMMACAEAGEAQGQDMSATRELVSRWQALQPEVETPAADNVIPMR